MSTPPPPPLPPPSVDDSSNSLSHIIRTTLSYDTNVMLAAIISLLLVILFVLLLHLYTRWFLLHARRRSRTTSATVPNAILRSTIHHHHHRFTVIDATNSSNPNSPNKQLGLPFAIISSLPLFVHKSKSEEDKHHDDYGSDCAICLSVFEEDEIGRKLPDCGHAFHVECIDMWLQSHSTCPICRGAIRCHNNPIRKIDHLEIEINDPDNQDNLNVSSTIGSNEDVLRLEIINITSINNQINQISEPTAIENDDSGIDASSSSSSSIGESIKKLLSNNGGKIHPSSNVNGDELSNA